MCFLSETEQDCSHGQDLRIWLIRAKPTTASLSSSGANSFLQQTVITHYLTHGSCETINKTFNATSLWSFLLWFMYRAAVKG